MHASNPFLTSPALRDLAPPHVRIEQQMISTFVQTGYLWWVNEHLAEFRALSDHDLALLDTFARTINHDESLRDFATDLIRLSLFGMLRRQLGQEWRTGLSEEPRARRSLTIDVAYSVRCLHNYRDRSAAWTSLVNAHAARLGLAPPGNASPAASLSFLTTLGGFSKSLRDVPDWALYDALDAEGVESIVAAFLTLATDPDSSEKAARSVTNIALVRPELLTPYVDRLIDRHPKFHGCIMLAASEETCARVLAMEPKHVLGFAWHMRRERAIEWLRASGHISKFVYEPGKNAYRDWILTSDGRLQDLFIHESYVLEPLPRGMRSSNAPVHAGVPGDYPGGGLMLDIDLTDSRTRILGLAGERLRLPLAIHENEHDHNFCDIRQDGLAIPRAPVSEEGVLSEDPNYTTLVMGRRRRTPFEVMFPSSLREISQFGGCPNWAQFEHYPVCPTCESLMINIAALDLFEVGYRAGVAYAFLCGPCRIASVLYQMD